VLRPADDRWIDQALRVDVRRAKVSRDAAVPEEIGGDPPGRREDEQDQRAEPEPAVDQTTASKLSCSGCGGAVRNAGLPDGYESVTTYQ
jgi:hypothetical protein